MRTIAIYAYGAGCMLAAFLVYAGISGIVTAKSAGGVVGVIEAVSLSFLPMLTLMLITFFAQRRLKTVALLPIPIVVAAAVSLFFAMGSHWAPGVGDPLALVHLALVAAGIAWGGRVLRSGGGESGEPSNSTPHADARATSALDQPPSARAGERER